MYSGIGIAINGFTDQELSQADSIEVFERMGEASTYNLRYNLDISGGDLPMLTDARLDPGSELSVLATLDNTTHCLVKGPVHDQHIHLQHGAAGSALDVKGSDTSIIMDRESKSELWKDLTDSDAVQNILSKYGYTPDVESTASSHEENKHTLVQRESDLSFIRRLARRNGFNFWISCDNTGTETAHFKRPSLGGSPTAQLVINLDSPNLATLDIEWDVERPTSISGKQLDLNAKSDIDVAVSKTPQTILGNLSLLEIAPDTRSVHLSAPADDNGNLRSRGEGAIIEADWFIRATCQTSIASLGSLVRAHTMVELRGAGSRHSGNYYVSAVKHIIDAVEHRMEIELIRNGWNK
jgi:phage protein D